MVEPIKSIVPQTFERFDPVIEITDHRGVDRIDPLTPFGPNAYKLDGTQNAEMLRDLGLGETQQLDEIVHRQRFVGERFENVAAYLFGYGSGTAAEAPNGGDHPVNQLGLSFVGRSQIPVVALAEFFVRLRRLVREQNVPRVHAVLF